MANTRESALAEARKLKQALLKAGVPQVSIEVRQGRPSPYGTWNAQFVVCSFAHHTVSRYNPRNKTPCLALIKNGRAPDLPGPLANGYGGFDLIARIITLGYANHPGFGGPYVVPSGVAKPKSYTIPKDSARRYAFGWEFEGGLSAADWDRVYTNAKTGKKMNYHEFMARCLNGTQMMYDLPLAAHLEHKTWAPRRKVDRMGYTKTTAIAKMKKFRVVPPKAPEAPVVPETPTKPAAPTLPEGPRGRSAWSKTGVGGTLEWDGRTPGRYYCLAAAGMPLAGSGGWSSKDGNMRAVHGGVRAIQEALNRRGKYGLAVTGVFDTTTRNAASRFRTSIGEDGWGGIGPATAKALLLPDLKAVCTSKGLGDNWQVVCGVVQNESAWDPGAVGYIKPVDIGLAQINGDAHPDMTEKERLDPIFAFTFICNYLRNAMKALDGNIDHAIASYNLGITGCKRWIAAGCPEVYTPPGSVPRNVPAYIDRIKSACADSNSKTVAAWS